MNKVEKVLKLDLDKLTKNNFNELMDEYRDKIEKIVGEGLKQALDSHSISTEDERIRVIANERVKIHLTEGHPDHRLYMLDGKIPLVEVKRLEMARGGAPRYGVDVTYWVNG